MKDLYGMPIKWNGDTGDAMLWAGLMVAVGDYRAVKGIKQCQSEDGRLWRAPDRVNNQPQNGFSRDMALGFILYFQETKDHVMADKWIKYLLTEKALFPSSESTDTRHIITPALWWLMSYAGMNVPAKWKYTRFLFEPYQKIELLLTPRGFERHLKAVSALVMSKYHKQRDKYTGRFLIKEDGLNPFFQWLAGDNEEARSALELHKADVANSGSNGSQWAWERSDKELAWLDAMGQDFEFIEKLLKLDIR